MQEAPMVEINDTADGRVSIELTGYFTEEKAFQLMDSILELVLVDPSN